MNMTAQQLYTDTFRLNDQKMTVDMDRLLLDMVAQQSAQLHARDTTMMSDTTLMIDSIGLADTLTLAERMALDSIERELREIDSLRAMNAELVIKTVEHIPTIQVEKSWIKDEEEDRNDVLRSIRDMKTHWRHEGTVMLQITQNYVTPNWYQGGSSSFAGLAILKGYINYITERFTWENTGEWRGGCSTISADSLHKVNTTDDLLRLYSKANYRIVPTLFGSVSAEIETRLLPTYKSNSRELKSGPFSPFRFNAALGLDYKPVPGLSISFSPLSYKVIHIMDTARVRVQDYGLMPGTKTMHNIGSSLRLEYNWRPVREFAMEMRFFTYTNYHYVELDLEVNCDFIINRWLTARLTLHPRYDTSVILEGDKHAKIQFRELLSIGFAHKFH